MSTLVYKSDTMVNVVSANMLDTDVPTSIVVTSMPRAHYDATYTTNRRKREVEEQEAQESQLMLRRSRREKRAISTDPLPAGYKWGTKSYSMGSPLMNKRYSKSVY